MLAATWTWAIGIIVTILVSVVIPSAIAISTLFSRLNLYEYRIAEVERVTKDLGETLHKLTETSIRMEQKVDQVLESLEKRRHESSIR